MAVRPDVEELRALYEGLCRRLRDDLSDERDLLLSECAVLMAIKEGVRRA